MVHFDTRVRLLAACLSALAGYVDALAFLKLGGFFVSFMSGNSTRLGVGIAQLSANAGVAGGLIATFVAGVFLGSLAGVGAGVHRRPVVLALVSVLLGVAAALSVVGQNVGAIAAMALAMGAENAVFEEKGDVRIGLTYMTGTLVKVGQRLAAAATGDDRLAWAPYVLLWAGLVLGATGGAVTYAHFGLRALWIAAGTALMLAACAAVIKEHETAPIG